MCIDGLHSFGFVDMKCKELYFNSWHTYDKNITHASCHVPLIHSTESPESETEVLAHLQQSVQELQSYFNKQLPMFKRKPGLRHHVPYPTPPLLPFLAC